MVKKGEKLSAEHLEKMRAGRAKKYSERAAVKEAAKLEKKNAAKKSTKVVAAPKNDDKNVEIPTSVPGAAATRPFVKEVKQPRVRGTKLLENPEAKPEEKPKGKRVGRSGKSAGLETAADLVNTHTGHGALTQVAGQKEKIKKDLAAKPPAGVMSEVSGTQGGCDETIKALPVHDPKALDGRTTQFSFVALRRTLFA